MCRRLTETRSLLRRKPFHGLSESYCEFFHKKIGHWSPGIMYSPFFSFAFNLIGESVMLISLSNRDGTYSWSDQFKPAGQRREPVVSWLKPRSSLLLRASGGIKGWSLGVIQSMTALFRPLVSSDLALLHPFCNCAEVNECQWLAGGHWTY